MLKIFISFEFIYRHMQSDQRIEAPETTRLAPFTKSEQLGAGDGRERIGERRDGPQDVH